MSRKGKKINKLEDAAIRSQRQLIKNLQKYADSVEDAKSLIDDEQFFKRAEKAAKALSKASGTPYNRKQLKSGIKMYVKMGANPKEVASMITGTYARTRVERYLLNQGKTAAQFAQEAGLLINEIIEEEDVINEANWETIQGSADMIFHFRGYNIKSIWTYSNEFLLAVE